MARRRMVPTRFFKDPDIMNLGSKDAQLILIGLILAADDEGREAAHAGMLGREMDYPAELVEAALQELVANDLLLLYQVGKHRYYQLTRWLEWQTLGGRITPSRYPAPPDQMGSNEHASGEQHGTIQKEASACGEKSGKSQGKSVHFPDQYKRRESKGREDDGAYPQNVLPFPTTPPADDVCMEQQTAQCSPDGNALLAQQIAGILRVPMTDALMRLVAEYASIASLSLPGEADAAREWIDDPHRNRNRKRMSPAFFRRWLQREQEALAQRQQALQQSAQATGATGGNPHVNSDPPVSRPRPPSLMHLAAEDAQAKGAKP